METGNFNNFNGNFDIYRNDFKIFQGFLEHLQFSFCVGSGAEAPAASEVIKHSVTDSIETYKIWKLASILA